MKRFFVFFAFVTVILQVQSRTYKVTEEVYLDIMIDDRPAGRMLIGLFGEIAPRTVKNFYTIATTGINGVTYLGSTIHKVFKRYAIQGGDIVAGNGSGSISIYGDYFEDETFEISHSGPGFISMANTGPNTNGCQFFITTIAAPWCDEHNVAFGKIIEGFDVLYKIEQTKTDVEDRPKVPVVIMESGGSTVTSPYTISDDPYDLWSWVKATAIPLGFSFSVLAFFHWMMKQLDV